MTEPLTLDKMRKEILKLYDITAAYGMSLAGAPRGDHLLSAIHQYNMWKLAFDTTYNLFSTVAGKGDSQIPEDIQEQMPGDPITDEAEREIMPTLDAWFTTNAETKITSELSMSMWATKSTLTMAKLDYQVATAGGINMYVDQHIGMADGVKACKAAIGRADATISSYTDMTLIINMGLMMLQAPEALSEVDLDALIAQINGRMLAIGELQKAMELIPLYEDPEISAMLEEYAKIDLNDYVDNILTGRVFGLEDTKSHAMAMVNMAEMGKELLEGCFGKLRAAGRSPGAMSAGMGKTLAIAGSIVMGLSNQILGATRAVAKRVMGVALSLIGISDGIVDIIMGVKMQIQALEARLQEAATSSMALGASSPGEHSECIITNLINIRILNQTVVAAWKNLSLMPFLTLSNAIIKPVLEALTDIAGEIKSYQDMIGEALADAYNLISLPRWIDYVLIYQLNQVKEVLGHQMAVYAKLKGAFMALKDKAKKIKPAKDKLKMVEVTFQAYIRKLNAVAQEHDTTLAEGKHAYEKLSEAIEILQSIHSLMSSRTATDQDKDSALSAILNYGAALEREASGRKRIKESSQNLSELWKGITKMRDSDYIAIMTVNTLEAFREYANIVKLIWGADLSKVIDEMQERIINEQGPLPVLSGQEP